MANRIRTAKKRFGLDNAELGDKLGVHRTTIGRWEDDPDKITGPASKLLDQMLANARTPEEAAPISRSA